MAAHMVNKHNGVKTQPYYCPICEKYHIGHRQPGDRGTVKVKKLPFTQKRMRRNRRPRLDEEEE